jgi:hypothetical protein
MNYIFNVLELIYQNNFDIEKFNFSLLGPVPKNKNSILHIKYVLCCTISGMVHEKTYEPHKWVKNMGNPNEEIVEKPQYFHSAAAIYLLITCPHLTGKDSFIKGINYKQLPLALKLALDILNTDEDGVEFIKSSNEMFVSKKEFCIIDEHNNSNIVGKNL